MIRLGTRGSALALAQARWVEERLGDDVEVVSITTSGDERRRGTPELTDKSRFVKEIEEALLAGEIDLAVHSAKDVPAELPDGLAIVGVPERADPRDALCGAGSLDDLADGAVVGTASLRRRALLLALRPDLDLRDLRGNVDTRLRRLAEGDYDAIVLAQAGLARLGRSGEGTPLDPDGSGGGGSATGYGFVPAAGQGCLVLEARSDRPEVAEAAGALTAREALACLTAERALVRALSATCHTPIGAFAATEGDDLRLIAFVGLPDGSHWIRDEESGSAADPAAVGEAVGRRMLAVGAGELLAEAEQAAARG